jgi:hypothetical protein
MDLDWLEAATYSAVECGAEEGSKEWRRESPFPGSAVDGVTVTVSWISIGRGHRFLV